MNIKRKEDFQRGNLKAFYRQNRLTDLSTLPVPRRDIHGSKGYFPLGVVQATRGCPYRCEFCSVRTFFGDTFRLRALNDVISEVKGMRHKLIMFNDDNIIGHPGYSRELLQAITPLKKKWMGQASLAGLRDEKTIRLMGIASFGQEITIVHRSTWHLMVTIMAGIVS